MKKKFKKWVCILLAVVMMVSSLPLIVGALAPSAEGSAESASSSEQSPLKVEIKSNKDKYTLLGKMEFTATITNISDSTVNNISAEALFGKDAFKSNILPLERGSQIKVTKDILAPRESFQLRYYTAVGTLKSLDNLLLPIYFFSHFLSHGSWLDVRDNGFNDGRAFVEASKSVGLATLFSGQYNANTTVRVWYGKTTPYKPPALDDEIGVWHEVFDNIDNIINSAIYTGNAKKDLEIAQNTYEKLIEFLDKQKQKGYVTDYAVGDSGISYTLCTGVSGALFWENIYYSSREEVQPQNIDKNNILALQSAGSKVLNIATLQPRYTNSADRARYKYDFFKTDIFDKRVAYVTNANSDYQFTTNLDDADVTIDVMKNLQNNRIIIIDTHGGIIEKANNSPFGFQLGVVVSSEEARSTQFHNDFYPEEGQTPRMVNGAGGVILTTEFFNYYYGDDVFDNTLFYLGACHGADNGGFAEVMQKKGVKVVLAYENSVRPEYNRSMYEAIMSFLSYGFTVEHAVAGAKTYVGETDDPQPFYTFINGITGKEETKLFAKLIVQGDGEWTLDKTYEHVNIFGELGGAIKDKDTNAPLADVTVTATNTKTSVTTQATTEANGTFYFLLPEGQYNLVFSKDGYVSTTSGVTVTRDVYHVMLEPVLMQKQGGGEQPTQGTINGKVLEQGTSAPLSGVLVQATKTATTAIVASATTNASGQYTLSMEKGFSYDLKFTRSGFAEQTQANINLVDPMLTLFDVVMVSSGSSGFAGGNGTLSSPYQISTPQQLANMRYYLTDNFILTNDIDLTGLGNWVPIGNSMGYFQGVFDGNGYAIKNMTVNVSSSYGINVYGGLFGYVNNGEIKNVGVIGCSVTASSSDVYAGGIVGYSYSSVISNCYNTGTVKASYTNNSSTVTIYAGGIAGRAVNGSTVDRCYNTGEILAEATTVFGYGRAFAGGIAGAIVAPGFLDDPRPSIDNCYNMGEITAKVTTPDTTLLSYAYAGGISGITEGSFSNCYNTGRITSIGNTALTSYSGGIAGGVSSSTSLISNCYYLDSTETKGTGKNSDGAIITNVLALSSSQMKQQSYFAGFNFTTIWAINPAINNGYPYLRSMQL